MCLLIFELSFSHYLLAFGWLRILQVHADDFCDLGKWQRAQIGGLTLVDGTGELGAARDRWIERERPFPCTFVDGGRTIVSSQTTGRLAQRRRLEPDDGGSAPTHT